MSDNISELQKLYAKTETVKVGDATLTLKELSLDDMAKLESVTENSSMTVIAKNAIRMFAMTLDVEESIVAKLGASYLQALLDPISKLNNFSDDDIKKTGIKDFIQHKKEQMEKNGKSSE